MTPDEIARWLSEHVASEGYPNSDCGALMLEEGSSRDDLYMCERGAGHSGVHSAEHGRYQWARDDTPSLEELAAYPVAVKDRAVSTH